jgi:hypothetical protein
MSLGKEILDKVDPARLPGLSEGMAGAIGCILNCRLSDPALESIIITSDGYVLGMKEGDSGYNYLVGREDELRIHWKHLLDCAELSAEQRMETDRLFSQIKHAAVKAGPIIKSREHSPNDPGSNPMKVIITLLIIFIIVLGGPIAWVIGVILAVVSFILSLLF